jgi:hypothetical protein
MILTKEQVQQKVSEVSGTWVKRRNLRAKLINQSNAELNARIQKIKLEIRGLKSEWVKEQALAPIYAKITELELRLIHDT